MDISTSNLHELMVSYYKVNVTVTKLETQKMVKFAVKFGMKSEGNKSLYPALDKLLSENKALK